MTNKTSFYSCKYDRVFKEVFLNPSNIDILKEFLEFTLETKIEILRHLILSYLMEIVILKVKQQIY